MTGIEVESNLSNGSHNGEDNDENGSAMFVDLNILHCPVCSDTLTQSIFQCGNGHIACRTCCTKLKNKCTLCPLPIGKIRNRVMERVIKSVIFPCPNAKFGCPKTFSYGQELAHDNECFFSPCHCPNESCDYTGTYMDIYNHFDDHDEYQCWLTYRFTFGHSSRIIVAPWDYVSFYMKETNDNILIIGQSFKKSHGYYVTLSCIAPSKVVGEFSCRISTVVGKYGITYELPKIKIVRKLSFETPEEDFVLIPSYIFSGRRGLKFSICINKLTKD